MSKTTVNTEDSRVNVLIRIVGLLFLAVGLLMTYETFITGANDGIQPPLVPVYYLLSGMLIVAGLAAVVAKYKPSGTPKSQ